MKIKVEMEIENCYSCPFIRKIYEQGCCTTVCKILCMVKYQKKESEKIALF